MLPEVSACIAACFACFMVEGFVALCGVLLVLLYAQE